MVTRTRPAPPSGVSEIVHPRPVPWISVIIEKAGDAARSLRSAAGATVGQVPRRRLILIAMLVVTLVSVAGYLLVSAAEGRVLRRFAPEQVIR